MQEGEIVIQDVTIRAPSDILPSQEVLVVTYTVRDFDGFESTITLNVELLPTGEFPSVDELYIAQGAGGENLIHVRNFDENAGELNGIIGQYRSSSATFRASVGGGAGRASYIVVGDVDNDGDEDLVDSFGAVTEPDGAFPNIFIPRDATTKLPIGHSRNAFRSTQYANGELTAAIGDFKEDGVNLIAVAQGNGSTNSLVRLFQYTGLPAPNSWAIVGQFQPLDNVPTANNANGGVFLAAGDVDGDGLDELIAGQTNSSTSLTQFAVINVDITGNLPVRNNFTAFVAGQRGQGGVSLAVADLNGDGINEIIVGSGGSAGTSDLGSLIGIVRPTIQNNEIIGFQRPTAGVLQVVSTSSGSNPDGGLSIASGDFDGNGANGQEILFGSGSGAPQSFYRIVRLEYNPDDGANGRRTGFAFLIGPPSNVNDVFPNDPNRSVLAAFSGQFEPTSHAVDVGSGNTVSIPTQSSNTVSLVTQQ
jgi:hypothetical protein